MYLPFIQNNYNIYVTVILLWDKSLHSDIISCVILDEELKIVNIFLSDEKFSPK